MNERKNMTKEINFFVTFMVILGIIGLIGSASAASYVWIEKDVRGVGSLDAEYDIDTEYGIATGIEMQEMISGSGVVSKRKWVLEVNPLIDEECVEGLIEKKELDLEYFPITYQNHSFDQKWLDKKCVKNYDIGAVVDANFVECEKMMLRETVVTYGDGTEISSSNVLEAGPELSIMQTVTADVLGISHIGFAAKDPGNHHHTVAYGREETIGQFQIDSTVEIGLACDDVGLGDWLGCP